MIRTKDLVLFVIVLLFLVVAIFSALLPSRMNDNVLQVQFDNTEYNSNIEATYEEEEVLDRKSIIARLREAIRNDDSVIAVSPSVEEVALDETESGSTSMPTQGVIFKCADTKNAIVFARTWPKEDVSVKTAEGARVVIYTENIEVPVSIDNGIASTSSSTLQKKEKTEIENVIHPLLQIPVIPVMTEPSCIQSEIVGVTQEGSLLFNLDAIIYYVRDSDELIGYARDGYPIYGNYIGETDECGGYTKDGSYRYTVSSERTYILGCYRAAPQSFVGE